MKMVAKDRCYSAIVQLTVEL